MSPKLRSVGVMDEYSSGESQQRNGCLVAHLGEASIMVWGAMSYDGVGHLTVVEGSITGETCRQTLQKHFLPLVVSRRRRKKETILKDNNAPVHRANLVKAWKKRNNLKCMEWTAQSPDLNPIENLWMTLKRGISARYPSPANITELTEVVQEEWKRIPLIHVQKLVRSMATRVKMVIKAKGFATKY